MNEQEFYAAIKRIVDPTGCLLTTEIIKLVEEKFTSTNKQSTRYCSPEFHKACHIAGCAECPHCKVKV